MVGDLGQRAGINLSASNVATAVAAIGAVLSGSQDGNLLNTVIDVATLQELGIDTTLLEENGITEINVAELIDSVPGLRDLLGTLGGGATEGAADGEGPMAELLPQAAPTLPQESAPLQPGSPLTSTATLSPTQPLTATEALAATATGTPTTATLPAEVPGALAGLIDRGQNLLGSFNLNTLNSELDRVLGQVGLQLRQGDVYLNRLGAERLGAQPGDLLEVFIGPIPVPFRVRAIVEEASPLGALLPVVVMRLDEGQQLLFMSGKVNNVLVSNEGDMLEGVQHTAAVSERLSVLAMDPDALAETVELLRRPSITSAIQEGAARPMAGLVDEEVPDFLVNIMGNFADFEGQTAAIADLAAGLDGDTLTEGMRSALANTEVRTWILNQNLSEADRTALADSMSELNQFDVLTPLSKETVLAAAGIGGSIFSSLFSIFGFFSVVAGILLIFLIYVMLAAERRSEMGIARAIGVQRPHLVQMFVSEGMVYSLAAGALGVLIGLGVSFVMIEYLGSIVNSVAGQLSATSAGILEFTFRVSPRTIIISYCLGVLFTFAIVFISSWRVSRLNIVAAIRDLPDNANARPRTVSGRIGRWIGPVLLLALGGVVLRYGFQWTVWSVVLIGATLLLFGIMQLVSRLLEAAHLRGETAARITYTLVGFGLLALWILPWQRFLPQLGLEQFAGDPTQILAVFAIGGPMIITGAIMVIMFNAAFFTGIIGVVFGGIGSLAPVLKTAIAYPLSTRFRTGVAMILFAMIMATVVVMSIVIQATQSLIVLDERESGGFTIQTSDTLLSFFDRRSAIRCWPRWKMWARWPRSGCRSARRRVTRSRPRSSAREM
jgi:putative ABC transport system permease protein